VSNTFFSAFCDFGVGSTPKTRKFGLRVMHQLYFHEISWIWSWVNTESAKIRTLCHATTLFSRDFGNQMLDQHFQSREVVIATPAQGILMTPFRRQGPLLPETNHSLRPRRKTVYLFNLLSFSS
jgi:hypothetical protein